MGFCCSVLSIRVSGSRGDHRHRMLYICCMRSGLSSTVGRNWRSKRRAPSICRNNDALRYAYVTVASSCIPFDATRSLGMHPFLLRCNFIPPTRFTLRIGLYESDGVCDIYVVDDVIVIIAAQSAVTMASVNVGGRTPLIDGTGQ